MSDLAARDLETLARAELQALISAVCLDEPVAYQVLRCPPGNPPVEVLPSLLEEASNSLQRSVLEIVFDLLQPFSSGATPKFTVRQALQIENLLALAEFCREGKTDEEVVGATIVLEDLARAKNERVRRSAVRVLSVWGGLQAHGALIGLYGEMGKPPSVLPAVLRSTAVVDPFAALDIICTPTPDAPPAMSPELRFAISDAMVAMFGSNGERSADLLASAASRLPAVIRAEIERTLAAPPLSLQTAAQRALLEIGGEHAGTHSIWQTFVEKAKATGEVRVQLTGFSEPGGGIQFRNPRPVYKRLHAELRDRVARSAKIPANKLNLVLDPPKEARSMLDRLLSWSEMSLDMQWRTNRRSQSADLLPLGFTSAFALICKGNDAGAVEEKFGIRPISPLVAKQLAQDSAGYREQSVSLSDIAREAAVEENQIMLITQASSAIDDELDQIIDRLVEEPLDRPDQVGREDLIRRFGRLGKGCDTIDDMVDLMMTRDGLPISLIEWNPISGMLPVDRILEQNKLSASLRLHMLEQGFDDLQFFPARFDSPLRAGYYIPTQDVDARANIAKAVESAFVDKRAKSWHADFRLLAVDVCVNLDDVNVFKQNVSDVYNDSPSARRIDMRAARNG